MYLVPRIAEMTLNRGDVVVCSKVTWNWAKIKEKEREKEGESNGQKEQKRGRNRNRKSNLTVSWEFVWYLLL